MKSHEPATPEAEVLLRAAARDYKKKQCSFCGNTNLSQKNVRYIYQREDDIMVVDDVPCIE